MALKSLQYLDSFIGKSVAKVMRATLCAFVIASGTAGTAQAQDIDWLVDIDDIVEGVNYDPSPAGATVRLTVTVRNAGFEATPSTTMSFNVPGTSSFVAAEGTITNCSPAPVQPGGTTITCDVPALATGESAPVTVDLLTTNDEVLVVEAAVPTAGESDDAPFANNRNSETITITNGSDIGVTITTPDTIASGSFFDYVVDIQNFGPNTAEGYSITVPIPAGVSNVTPPAGCTLVGLDYICAITDDLAVNATNSLSFNGQVTIGGNSDITSTVSVSDVTPGDPNPANDLSSDTLDVTAGTDAFITKTRSPSGPLIVGEEVTFTINTGYNGDAPTGATVTDMVPSNYTIRSVSATGGYACTEPPFDTNDITCTSSGGGAAGANQSLGTITIVAVADVAGSAVRNVADLVTTGSPDTNTANNTANDGGIAISARTADLSARKIGPDPRVATVNDGVNNLDTYEYLIGARNRGNTPFFGTIVLTDSIPAGMRVESATFNDFDCRIDDAPLSFPFEGPQDVVCKRDYLESDPLLVNTNTDSVVFVTAITQAGTIRNDLVVTTENTTLIDPDLGNNARSYSVEASVGGGVADIAVLKTVGSDPANPPAAIAGEDYTFDIEIVNNGDTRVSPAGAVDSETVVVRDVINHLQDGTQPFAISYQNTPEGSCRQVNRSATSSILSCTIAVVPMCEQGVNCPIISVTVVPGGDLDSRQNVVTANSRGTPDPNSSNNRSTLRFPFTPRVDMTVSKSATGTRQAGRELSYVIAAENLANGLSAAENVVIRDTLPAGVTFVSVDRACTITPPVGAVSTATENNLIVCELGDIDNGSQRTVEVIVRPNFETVDQTIINTVVVESDTDETNPSNNTATAASLILPPDTDILINKSDDVDPLARSDFVTYQLTVTNAGPSASEQIVVTDEWPDSIISYQSVTPPVGGTCSTEPAVDSFGETLVCEIPYLIPGESRDIFVVGRGDARGAVVNNVSVSSLEILNGFDREDDNNQTEENTTVRSRTDLEIVSKVASQNIVSLNDDFDFVVTMRVNEGPRLFEAYNVNFNDTLPDGMRLVGPVSADASGGTPTQNSCSGLLGSQNVLCSFGVVQPGTTLTITIPVEITTSNQAAQVFENTATATTVSIDIDPSNNTGSGSVTVGASSIAGTVFRDFADDTAITAGDTRISGVTMTLEGSSFDNPNPGTPNITRTVQTDSNGDFLFSFLPAGSYTVTRGEVNEPFLTDGTLTPGNNDGSQTGTVVAGNVITDIALPAATANVENLFPVVPQARIGIAKAATLNAVNADGTFAVTFDMIVENFSTEPLINVAVTDQISGAAPLFGSFVSLGNPATDPMTNGTYTVLAPPSGSCGVPNASFDGQTDLTLASSGALGIGDTCTVSVQLRVLPTAAQIDGGFENQAIATGEGAISGQNPDNQPFLTDASDNGVDPDPNGDGVANGPGEDDPTPVTTDLEPGIALVKTADLTAISDPVMQGDVITYRFAVRNTGESVLTNVTVMENLIGATVSGSIASLAPGETDDTSIIATYAVSLDDVNASLVENSASVTGTDPFGRPVTDDSGADFDEDAPLQTSLTRAPDVAVVKTIAGTSLQDPPQAGDIITYAFEVTNTGNVTLSDLTITDPLTDLVLQGDPIPTLLPGQTNSTAYTATYAIKTADIEAGELRNRATVTGSSTDETIVTDESGLTIDTDEDTIQPLTTLPLISLDKIAMPDAFLQGAAPGDEVSFAFAITNTGNIPLDNVTITDSLPGFVLTGAPFDDLAPGETNDTAWSGTYALTEADIAAGQVVNTADVTATHGPGDTAVVTDQDVEIVALGNIQAIPEVFPPFTEDGGTTTSMLASDLLNGESATLENVTISVISADDGVTLDPETGLITLAPGFPAGSYEVTYQIESRTVPGLIDTTTETVVQSPRPAIETVKTQAFTDNGDGFDSVGDLITYTIAVTNTGNTPLGNVTIVDTLVDFDGAALTLTSGPDFVSADAGSDEGSLAVGETATYAASFEIDTQAANAGGVRNVVVATGDAANEDDDSGGPITVSDVSDDGDDTDGNTEDDPTERAIVITDEGVLGAGEATVSMTKTTPAAIVRRGDTVPFTITVTNNNSFAIGPADITDRLPDGMVYIPGSATIDGVAADITFVAGTVTWEGISLPPAAETVVTLNVRILNGVRPGSLTNTASLSDVATGDPISANAVATVQILPEAVFDCTEVIGRVFHDLNGNGYQDAPDRIDRSLITDQTYDGGKGKPDRAPEPRTEIGIPGVRLATVDGTVITTDANGLYSVPCASLPAENGANFILKLDTRSLPAGYRMTTENPRVMRLTPGMMTEMNFGAAAAGQVVRIDLNQNAFHSDGTPSAALTNGLRGVLQQITSTPSNIVLAYHMPASASAQDVATARALLDRVEAQIKADWRDIGRTRLRIEQTLVRAGQ